MCLMIQTFYDKLFRFIPDLEFIKATYVFLNSLYSSHNDSTKKFAQKWLSNNNIL
jgi:hypothetical protein